MSQRMFRAKGFRSVTDMAAVHREIKISPLVQHLHRVGQHLVSIAKPLTAVRTGRLRASIEHRITKDYTILFGSPVEYAYYYFMGHRSFKGNNVLIRAIMELRAQGHKDLTLVGVRKGRR